MKKPGIILLTQASLSKLLTANDLNVINNNSNTNTANHAHFHQHDNNIRSKCNIPINTTTNPKPSQINNQLTSVLMINSTSTIETSAGVVTLTTSTGSSQPAAAPARESIDENAKNSSQQVNIAALISAIRNRLTIYFLLGDDFIESQFASNAEIDDRAANSSNRKLLGNRSRQ